MALAERWIAFRNRLLGSASFRRKTQGLPVINSVAKQSANRLFALCAGFTFSQVLYASAKLGLIEKLQSGPKSVDVLARETELYSAKLKDFLDAGTALDLFQALSKDRYALGPLGATLCENPGVMQMVLHHVALYQDLAQPEALLHEGHTPGALGRYWSYSRNSDEATTDASVAAFSELMAESQSMIVEQVLQSCSFRQDKTLLDIGGGEGAFALAIAKANPHLGLTIADLPPVVARAKAKVAEAGLSNQVSGLGGDFRNEAIPGEFDVVTLVRILHDHDDEAVLGLLRQAYAALHPAGRLLVIEPMQTPGSSGDMLKAYFTMYFLAMGQGRLRRSSEINELLKQSGFQTSKSIPTKLPLITSILEARKA